MILSNRHWQIMCKTYFKNQAVYNASKFPLLLYIFKTTDNKKFGSSFKLVRGFTVYFPRQQ